MSHDPEQLLTAKEAGAILGMSAIYVHDRAVGRQQPQITSYRLGNRLRFKREDILKFKNDNLKKVELKKVE